MRHAILGAGAVGGLLATILGSLGEEVVAIVRPERLSEYSGTFSAERPAGNVTAPVNVAAELRQPADVLWIATKTFHLLSALKSIKAIPRCVVPLLNGTDHVGVLRQRFGSDRVVPATIGVEAEKVSAEKFLQKSQFVRLNVASSGEPILGDVLSGLAATGFTCQFIANEQTLLWSKLCFLGPYALVTSASRKNNGEVAANSEWKSRLESAIHEACAVATALGAEVDAAKILAFIASASPEMRSSMQKDVEAGRPTELDDIAGPILRGGNRFHIPVPTTEGLVETIRARIAARNSAAQR
jgi:2-dehydropantoate 2-reductase